MGAGTDGEIGAGLERNPVAGNGAEGSDARQGARPR